jgi:phosphoribosylformimino-5-aminoimidazole carboxamide ribotide isomerase
MTLFRPCIDLHAGLVKQIVGGSLKDAGGGPVTNFVAAESAGYFAKRYRADGLHGGHVIQLGPGNEVAALEALAAWPQGLHLGGGVDDSNARRWLESGAEKVIVTSFLFEGSELSEERLRRLSEVVGRSELVIDVSCRRVGESWRVATNRWQTITETRVDRATLDRLAGYCSEFLIHAADVEGLCQGIDESLVETLGRISPIPCTYAGGGRHLADLQRVSDLSGGRVDLTFGSALDLFGGKLVAYADCVAFNRRQMQKLD